MEAEVKTKGDPPNLANPADGVGFAVSTFAVTTPESCVVPVVATDVQSSKCPFVGTTVGPTTVWLVVAPLPQVLYMSRT